MTHKSTLALYFTVASLLFAFASAPGTPLPVELAVVYVMAPLSAVIGFASWLFDLTTVTKAGLTVLGMGELVSIIFLPSAALALMIVNLLMFELSVRPLSPRFATLLNVPVLIITAGLIAAMAGIPGIWPWIVTLGIGGVSIYVMTKIAEMGQDQLETSPS